MVRVQFTSIQFIGVGVDLSLLVNDDRHEHLYPGVEEELIRTDELPDDPRQLNDLFVNVRVVLCTLSSLSNPVIQQKVCLERVPINNLVVDEASQISVFQYLVREVDAALKIRSAELHCSIF